MHKAWKILCSAFILVIIMHFPLKRERHWEHFHCGSSWCSGTLQELFLSLCPLDGRVFIIGWAPSSLCLITVQQFRLWYHLGSPKMSEVCSDGVLSMWRFVPVYCRKLYLCKHQCVNKDQVNSMCCAGFRFVCSCTWRWMIRKRWIVSIRLMLPFCWDPPHIML